MNYYNRIFSNLHYALIAAAALAGFIATKLYAVEDDATTPAAPELAGISRWINSQPLALENLRGKVVVLHFWTFGCINCRHNLPYYNRWRKDFPVDQLEIIGVHTPEFDQEADLNNVAQEVKRLGIEYPVAVDNDRAAWRAYKNRYWPAIYLIDRTGHVRYRWDGELEYEHAGGDKILRDRINRLLAEEITK